MSVLRTICFCSVVLLSAQQVGAESFHLLIGMDAGLFPGQARMIAPLPGPGFPGSFFDGDRLAGTADVGPEVVFQGVGEPLIDPNEFGALSFLFKRGTIPVGGGFVVPFMGIDFLGGPRLDLDGDLDNGTRSLIPVADQTAAPIPNSSSLIELDFDVESGTVTLLNLDATGTNEAGPNISAEIAVVIQSLAGTTPDGTLGKAINPDIDTRSGAITAYAGNSGTLSSVFRIEDLGYEFWQDTLSHTSATAGTLGTFQYLGSLRGWLIRRDAGGQFPALTDEGLGGTLWPMVDTSQIGNTFNTANGLAGGSATITGGPVSDSYSIAGNGGETLTDFSGDLGAYFDGVVIPLISGTADAFIYLESAGFGINNSQDPVFTDTIAYDVVLLGQACKSGPDINNDGRVNAADLAALLGSWGPCPSSCCAMDLNGDGVVNPSDLAMLLGAWGPV